MPDDKAYRRALSLNIRAALAVRRMTQGELALHMGVSRKTVNEWATGKAVPSALTLRRIAYVLGVPPEYLGVTNLPDPLGFPPELTE